MHPSRPAVEPRDLPYLDEHAIRIPASRESVWAALERYADTYLRVAAGHPLARILGTEPAAGFEILESRPAERLTLVGRHRFSRYLLRFELADAGQRSTLLRAQSYAAFPGVHGRVYRTLVIGTRFHVVATKHILRSIRRASLELEYDSGPGGV